MNHGRTANKLTTSSYLFINPISIAGHPTESQCITSKLKTKIKRTDIKI